MYTLFDVKKLLNELKKINKDILKIVPENGWRWKPKTYQADASMEKAEVRKALQLAINNNVTVNKYLEKYKNDKKDITGKFFTELLVWVSFSLYDEVKLTGNTFFNREDILKNPSNLNSFKKLEDMLQNDFKVPRARIGLFPDPIYNSYIRNFLLKSLFPSICLCAAYRGAVDKCVELIKDAAAILKNWFSTKRDAYNKEAGPESTSAEQVEAAKKKYYHPHCDVKACPGGGKVHRNCDKCVPFGTVYQGSLSIVEYRMWYRPFSGIKTYPGVSPEKYCAYCLHDIYEALCDS